MSDYTPTYDFSAKDALATGDANKLVKGTEVDLETAAIQTAVATKANKISGGTANYVVEQDANGDIIDTGLATPTGAFVGISDTQTLTNKTLTTPVINGALTGTSLVDSDTMAGVAADTLCSGESIKAYVDAKVAGTTVQIVNTQTGVLATGTTALVMDDTIPQNTEGDEYMTLAITPVGTNNKLKIDVVVMMAHSNSSTLVAAALFQDSTAGALAAMYDNKSGSTNSPAAICFTHFMTAGTESVTTFKVRAGGNNGATTTFNGTSGARIFGGVMASSITITEIKV